MIVAGSSLNESNRPGSKNGEAMSLQCCSSQSGTLRPGYEHFLARPLLRTRIANRGIRPARRNIVARRKHSLIGLDPMRLQVQLASLRWKRPCLSGKELASVEEMLSPIASGHLSHLAEY